MGLFLICVIVSFVYIFFFSNGSEDFEKESTALNQENFIGENALENSTSEDSSFNEEIILSDPRDNLSVLYWYEMPIPYHFASGYECDKIRKGRVEYAFKLLSQATKGNISFVENFSTDKGIEIKCLQELVGEGEREDRKEKKFAVAGEGGITEYSGNRIISGSFSLYQINPEYEYCKGYPGTELHEILHVFGMDHVTDRVSIMNSQRGYGLACQLIDDEIDSCLKYLYGKLNPEYTCKKAPFLNLVG